MELKNYRSYARWPEGTVAFSADGSQITTDDHDTEEQARAVCKMLKRDGYGGDEKIFPVETWVTPIPFEEQYPEEAEVMYKLCNDKELRETVQAQEAKYPQSERIYPNVNPLKTYMRNLLHGGGNGKPFQRANEKIGRNDACPCGSGKKYKKCCA